MGSRAVHCGAAGAGQAAKICNNMILGISMIGVCEAFALAEKLGLDPHALYDVVSTSSGACWSVTTYCPVPGVGPTSPADHDYRPGFAAELMLKDLGLGQQAAAAVDAATPLGAAGGARSTRRSSPAAAAAATSPPCCPGCGSSRAPAEPASGGSPGGRAGRPADDATGGQPLFIRFSIRSSTTPGSARVEVSPRAP